MLFPNVAVTRGIAVRVAVSFLAEQSDPASAALVLVLSCADREWLGRGGSAAVAQLDRSSTGGARSTKCIGEGVVGEMPLIGPGASFDYVSGCPLDTPSGAMSGSYRMVDENGDAFEVAIPRFQLLSV